MSRIFPKINKNNYFFYIGLFFGIILYLMFESQIGISNSMSWILFYIGTLFLLLQSLLVLKKYRGWELFLILCFLFVSIYSGVNSTNIRSTLLAALAITAAKGQKFSEIARFYFIVGASFLIFHVIGSSLGFIESTITEEHDVNSIEDMSSLVFSSGGIRRCFGYGWPTDFANHLFFVLLSFWIFALRKIPLIIMEFILISLSLFVFYFVDCRLSSLCILCLAFLSLGDKLWYRLKLSRLLILKGVIILFIPFCAYLSYYLTWIYDDSSPGWMVADLLVSRRLSLGHDALVSPGISIWGQYFKMYAGSTSYGLYNYVDNSFVQSLVVNGLVYTVLLCVFYVRLTKKAIQKNNFYVICSVLLASISAIIAQHFLQFFMNVTLLAFTSDIDDFRMIKDNFFKKTKKKRRKGIRISPTTNNIIEIDGTLVSKSKL